MSWKTFDIPADGPDAALVRVVRHLRLPYTRTYVNRALLEHPKPNSLLALVEVSRALGIETTPARTEPEALADLGLPVVVHFDAAGTEGGFGVLESVSAEGYRVWDSVNGARTVAPEPFLDGWSGIVVLMEPGEGRGPREKGYAGRRLFEMVAGRLQPPALVGNRAAPALRAALAALLVALLAVAVARRPPADRVPAAALELLAAAGLLVAAAAAVTVGDRKSPLSMKVCKRGRLIDCEGVLTSRYSRAFGIPLSEIGIGFFGGLLLLLAFAGPFSSDAAPWVAVAIAFGLSLPLSLALIGVQVKMRQLCTLCLAVHAINISGALVGWISLGDASWDGVGAALLLVALVGAALVLVVVPHVMGTVRLEALSDSYRRILASPFATVARLQSEALTSVSGPACGLSLGSAGARHELVVFVHPGCSRCDPALVEVGNLVTAGSVDAYVAIAPRVREEADRRACRAVLALTAGFPPEARLQAYAAAKPHIDDLLSSEDPAAVLAERLDVPVEHIAANFEVATALVERAEELADVLTDSTPAFFLDRRPYRAPLRHLAFLVSEHPDLLEPKPSRASSGAPR